MSNKTTYRVDGFSCANCAKTFENNVKKIPGIEDAHVNFGASKIEVIGSTTIQLLEEAGAFENLKLRPENQRLINKPKQSFMQKYLRLSLCILIMLAGFTSQYTLGEKHTLTILLMITSVIISGMSLFKSGLTNLRNLEFDMKTLMTLASIGGAIIGEWSEVAVIVILFAISEEMETYSMDKARDSIAKLMDLSPNEAIILKEGKEILVNVDDIQVNDIMIIKPGQRIAMDGKVISGDSWVNQATITGESIPVHKKQDDEVFAGTINTEGHLEVRITKLVADTTLSKIIHLVEEAQGKRAPAQRFVDTFAKYYTPIIMIIALLVMVIPPLLFKANPYTWFYQGLAVLVVGCPCALVISTPIALVSAMGNAASNGVLIKGGIHLEELGNIKAIAFDKTGTLTKGEPKVTDYILIDKSYQNALDILVSLESKSQHPLAKAIIEYGNTTNLLPINNFTSITGKGIQGEINNKRYYVGSPITPNDTTHSLQKEGKTVMVLTHNDTLIAIIAVADTIRENSKDVIKNLNNLGINKTIMLTGDNSESAKSIGSQIGVSEIKAQLLPQDKLTALDELKQEYKHVAMVGDGINDAPALAHATVGIVMGGIGSDSALETADIALMGDDLSKLPFTIGLSRKTLNIIKSNIAFAIIIKAIALLLVIPGWLTLWIAIASDMGATVLVALNGLRLLKYK